VEINKAATDSSIVAGKRSITILEMGTPLVKLYPKSPLSTPPNHLKYLITKGSFNPKDSLSASNLSGEILARTSGLTIKDTASPGVNSKPA
jgi:hypothetical protein